jgi:DNA-binding GntR family transcriptional regulator
MKKLKSVGTLADKAFNVIKEAIINNEIKPFETITEEELAEKLGISRTPIRTALKKLAYEGLVEMDSGRQTRVRMISIEEALEYQVLREVVEPLSAKLACINMDEEQLAFLKEMCVRQKECIDEKDFSQFISLDAQFHFYIAEFSNNNKLKELISTLGSQMQRFIILTNTIQTSAEEAFNEHLEIVRAFEQNLPQEAEHQMKCHVKNISDRFSSL